MNLLSLYFLSHVNLPLVITDVSDMGTVIHTCMSVSLTGSRGSKVVAALRLSNLWEMWKMSKPLEPRRIDLTKKWHMAMVGEKEKWGTVFVLDHH